VVFHVGVGYRQDLKLLRDRRFALLFTARTVSVFGGAFVPVALAFGVLGLPGATATTLSVVLTAQAVPEVVFLLAGGVLADRLPRYRVMMAGELMCALASTGLGAMLLTGWAPVVALAAGAALTGIAIALFYPALTGIVPEVVAADRLQPANGLLRLGTNSARIGGFALAGGAVALFGGGWALLIGAGLYVVAACLIAGLRAPAAAHVAAAAGRSAFADLWDGWREFASRQWLWVIVLQFSVIVAALQAAHGVFGPVVAKQELGGAPAWSAVLIGEAVGMLVGVVIAIRIRPRRPMLVATLAVLPTGLPYALLGAQAPLWMVVGGALVMGVSFDVFGVLWETTMQREIPPAALSRVSSYDALGSFMFGPIGLVLAGPVAAAVGVHRALLGSAAVILAVTLAALLAPEVRNLRAPTTPVDHGVPAPEMPHMPGMHPAETP
jgi:Transmembrane secretion effector